LNSSRLGGVWAGRSRRGLGEEWGGGWRGGLRRRLSFGGLVGCGRGRAAGDERAGEQQANEQQNQREGSGKR